jgi:hypothetical protein
MSCTRIIFNWRKSILCELTMTNYYLRFHHGGVVSAYIRVEDFTPNLIYIINDLTGYIYFQACYVEFIDDSLDGWGISLQIGKRLLDEKDKLMKIDAKTFYANLV